jgi:osmoprotectant transport system ATP-binding protein
MIRPENVAKVFESPAGTTMAADRISFGVADGEIRVLLGPSARGKTTTLRTVNRLVEPTLGKITLNGQDIPGYDLLEPQREIGCVSRQIGLFPGMTVEENIRVVPKLPGRDMANGTARTDRIEHAVKRLDESPDALPSPALELLRPARPDANIPHG